MLPLTYLCTDVLLPESRSLWSACVALLSVPDAPSPSLFIPFKVSLRTVYVYVWVRPQNSLLETAISVSHIGSSSMYLSLPQNNYNSLAVLYVCVFCFPFFSFWLCHGCTWLQRELSPLTPSPVGITVCEFIRHVALSLSHNRSSRL